MRHGQALLPQRKGDLCHVGGGGGFYLVFTMAIASGLLYTIHRWLTCGNVGKKFKPFVRRLQKWGKIDGTGCIGKLFRRWVELKETSTFWDDLPACGPVFHYIFPSTRETITAPNASKPQNFPQTLQGLFFFSKRRRSTSWVGTWFVAPTSVATTWIGPASSSSAWRPDPQPKSEALFWSMGSRLIWELPWTVCVFEFSRLLQTQENVDFLL